MRNALAYATHKFFKENGFLWLSSPIITASDCEGAGEQFCVTTLVCLSCILNITLFDIVCAFTLKLSWITFRHSSQKLLDSSIEPLQIILQFFLLLGTFKIVISLCLFLMSFNHFSSYLCIHREFQFQLFK